MAYFTETSTARTYVSATAPKHDLAQAILSKLSQWMGAIALRHAQNRVFRKTMNELCSLSNRDLADLGLSRSELRRVAREAAQSVTNA